MRVWFPFSLLVVLFMVAAPSAVAHASLLQAEPAPGTTRSTVPAEVWVEFNEPVEPDSTKLEVYHRATMSRVDIPSTLERNTEGARVQLMKNLTGDAAYVANWEALSRVDGHTSNGAWAFGVGTAFVPPVVDVEPRPIPWVSVLAKSLIFIGLAGITGFLAFHFFVLGIPMTAMPGWMIRGATVGAILQVTGLFALLLSEAGNSGRGLTEYVTATAFGRGLAIRLLFAVVTTFLILSRRTFGWIGPVLATTVAASIATGAYFSHSAALGANRISGAAVDALHVLAAATWAGGVLFLFAALRRQTDADSRAALLVHMSLRFSRLAQVSVAVLTLTGIAMLVVVLGPDVATWFSKAGTRYGFVLVYKVLLAALMVVLGGANHVFFVRRFSHADAHASTSLFRANVRREAFNGLLILIVAALLTNLAPAV